MSHQSNKWDSRPVFAGAVRAFVLVAPILFAIIAVLVLGRAIPRPPGLVPTVLWWIGLTMVSTLVLWSIDKLLRRLLPVVALFKLSLAFPDHAPSRFKTAIRSGTVRQLERQVASGQLSRATPQEAAEQLIALAATLNEHDRLTRGHTERVRAYSAMIGEEMGLDETELEFLNWSGLVHDIGKLSVPSEILNKPGKLDEAEWAILREHPAHADVLIEPLRPWLGEWAESATQHHERFDGAGYPNGLSGYEISRAGRIVAVADAYDVMTSVRSYKKATTATEARRELARHAGDQFDPEVVRAFLNVAIGRLRLVMGPLSALVYFPAGSASLGSAAATTAGAAASVAVAALVGVPAAEPAEPAPPAPDAVAFVAADAPDLVIDGMEDQVLSVDIGTESPLAIRSLTIIEESRYGVATVDGDVIRFTPNPDTNGVTSLTYKACFSDDTCDEGTLTLALTPVNDAPRPVDDTATVAEDESVTVNVLANDLDVDGGELRVTDFTVSWPDHEPSELGVELAPGGLTITPAPDQWGHARIDYEVTEPDGLTDEATVRVEVTPVNDSPEAANDVAVVIENRATTIDVLANDTDIDDDALSIVSISSLAGGTATIVGDQVRFTPFTRYVGEGSFRYTASDGNGGISTAEAALEIVPVGTLPALVDDVAGALEDTPTTIDVLANDSSIDATVDPATLRIDQPPTAGATSVVDGVVRYTPGADWSGSDSFDYLACDTNDYCGTATVTVTVTAVNDAPSFGAGADQTVPEDHAPVTVAGWASGLTVDPTDESTQTAVFVVTTVDPSLFSSQPAIDPAGTLTYSLAADANGTTTASVTMVDDGGTANGGSDTSPAHTLSFTILPSNDAPSFGAGADQTVAEDSGPTVVPGWATGISPGPADESGQATVFGSVTAGPGLFTVTPAVAPDGTLSFTPAPDANGTTTVTVSVQDDGGTENAGIDTSPNHTLTVTITASNDAPVANDDAGAGYSTSEDTALITPDVTTNDTDVDDPINPGSVVLMANGTNGTAVSNGDGSFTYTPDPNWSGTDTFTYTITDPEPLTSDQATITVVVGPVNDAPDVTNPEAQTADAGLGFNLQIMATDIEFDDLSYGAAGLPAGLSISGTGLISGTTDPGAVGIHSVDVTVTDDGTPNEATIMNFVIDVAPHTASTHAGSIVINEVLHKQAGNPLEEFVELYNAGGSAVDLTGWTLADANLKVDGMSSLNYTVPATDHWGTTSVLQPGEYAVIWLVYDGATLPPVTNPASGLEFVVNDPAEKLGASGDVLWLLDTPSTIVDHVAYGVTAGMTGPASALGLWNDSAQLLLNTAPGQSISLSPNGVDGNTSACWERTGSGDAAGRCPGALATYDSDSIGGLKTSVALYNNSAGADAGGPYAIAEGDGLVLNGSGAAGTPIEWYWDLDNDGQYDDASGMNPSLSWATLASLGIDDDGVYPIALEVDDGTGRSTTTVTVTNVAPALSTSGTSTASTAAPYSLNLGAVDPGADTIASWTINWGDGTIDTIPGNPATATHTYSSPGFTFDILASATDEDGTYFRNELLVPSYDGDTVFRFAAETGAFSEVFATADDPTEGIIGPDGRLYVSGDLSSNVLRYNATTGAYIDEFVTAGEGGLNSAEGMAFGPDGHLYVGDWSSDRVLRFDGTTGAFIDIFADSGIRQPYDLIFGPDSNLYVGNYNNHSIVRLDGTSGALVDTFVGAGSGGLNKPEQMTFGPDGNLYVASFNSGEVLRYNGTTGAFIDVFIAAGGVADLDKASGLAFGPDGHLYVGDHVDHMILRFHGDTGAFLGEYVTMAAGGLSRPHLMTFLPDQQVTVTG
ncbi:MAG: tandem-95 repeat protein [Actinomycetia bacterium]|nr:tandem-95 repeat protein [Actinomycetes bacterium]